MAFRSKFRSFILLQYRLFCTSKSVSDSKTLLSSRDKARATLSLIHSENNPEHIINACSSINLSPKSHIDRVAYLKAISKLRESDNYEGIRRLIKLSMDKQDYKTERVVSYFIVLYGKSGLISDAVKLFGEMPDMNVERNVKTLNSLLFSCDLAGEYDEMKRILTEFPTKYELEPDLDTYNTVLRGFCRSGRANEAHNILAEMELNNIKPNAKTFATAIEGFYLEERYSDVGKMMQLMTKHGIGAGISIYNVRIKSLCKLKRSSEAMLLFDGLVSRGVKPNSETYSYLIHGLCRDGKLDAAKKLYEGMIEKDLKPEAECYYALVYYLCEGRDFEAALDICKKCMAKDWIPNITTMKMLVDGIASIGKVNDARNIIKQVKKKFSRNADQWSEIERRLPASV